MQYDPHNSPIEHKKAPRLGAPDGAEVVGLDAASALRTGNGNVSFSLAMVQGDAAPVA
jgi:hypothetical protein